MTFLCAVEPPPKKWESSFRASSFLSAETFKADKGTLRPTIHESSYNG